eukprot:g431.t1
MIFAWCLEVRKRPAVGSSAHLKNPSQMASLTKVEESCMRLLRGTSDEEKVSGLLLSAKHLLPHINAADDAAGDRGTLRFRIFEATGDAFFSRLLRTEATKYVALAVLCRLSADATVAAKLVQVAQKIFSRMTDLIDSLKKSKRGDNYKAHEGVEKSLKDAVQCSVNIVECASFSASSARDAISRGFVPVLIDLLRIMRPMKRRKHAEATTKTDVPNETATTSKKGVDGDSDLSSCTASLLLAILRRAYASDDDVDVECKRDRAASSEERFQCFYVACNVLRAYPPPVQWTLLAAMPLILRCCEDNDGVARTLESGTAACSWDRALREGLEAVWVVKQLPRQLRNISFQLSLMVSSASLDLASAWFVERVGGDKGDEEGATSNSCGRFLQLWVSLATNELKFLLDDAIDWMDPSDDGSSSSSVAARKSARICSVLFRTLEVVVGALCRDDSAGGISERVTSTSLLAILRALRESAEMIIGFQGVALEAIEALSKSSSSATLGRRGDVERLILQSLRLVGVYLIADTDESIHAQFFEILPRLCAWTPASAIVREGAPLQYLLPALECALSDAAGISSPIASSVAEDLFGRLMVMTSTLPTAPACAAARVARMIVRNAHAADSALFARLSAAFENHWSSRVVVGSSAVNARALETSLQGLKEAFASTSSVVRTSMSTKSTDANLYGTARSSSNVVRVATCNLAQHAMDFRGNADRIRRSIIDAKAKGARYRLGPELEISGYGCQDHFLETDTFRHSWQILASFLRDAELTKDIVCDIGMPVIHRGVRYNCRVFCLNRRILLIRPKLFMANDGNYREHRYFTPWDLDRKNESFQIPPIVSDILGQKSCPFGICALEFLDASLAAETCEELFTPRSPHILFGLNGIDIISNGSGSHHQLRKLNTRVDLMKNATSKGGGAYLYANQQGFDGGRLYFDGCAMVVVNGSVRALGHQFAVEEMQLVIANIDIDSIRSYRAAMSSRSDQAAEAEAIPRVSVNFHLTSNDEDVHLVETPAMPFRTHSPAEEIGLGPACWLWDYLRRSGAQGFFLPLSGGADSASTCAIVGIMCHLVVDAIRRGDENVLEDARRVAGQTSERIASLKHRIELARADITRAIASEDEVARQYASERVKKAEALLDSVDVKYVPNDPREFCRRIMHTAYMGTKNSGDATRTRAINIANQIGSFHIDCKVDDIVEGLQTCYKKTAGYISAGMARGGVIGGMPKDLSPGFRNEKRMCWKEDLALQNIQARSRMVYSYKLAQMLATPAVRDKSFILVLGSANVDEAIYGYYTKYDCSAADLNPIGGVCKTDLKMFLKWAGRTYQWPALLETEKAPPSAELRPGEESQTDEDDMRLTYAELSTLGRLRKVHRMGIYSMTKRLIDLWGQQESLSRLDLSAKGPEDAALFHPTVVGKAIARAMGIVDDALTDVEIDFVAGLIRITATVYLDRERGTADATHRQIHDAVERLKRGDAKLEIDSATGLVVKGGIVRRTQKPMSPREVSNKVKRFYQMHLRNRHKMTTLTPSYHAENYSPDDNRFDLRPFCYNLPMRHQWGDVEMLVDAAQKRFERRTGEAS